MAVDVIDFVKEQKALYMPKTEPVIVDVPEMSFIMMDGRGMPDPQVGTAEDIEAFTRGVGTLYGIVYLLKFADKKGLAPASWHNFKVPPLEALWDVPDGASFDMANASQWTWTMIMRVPDFVTPEVLEDFTDYLANKKKDGFYKQVRLERYREGPSVQLMHIGPYDAEGPSIDRMHEYAVAQGYKIKGKHHEIYFSDPRRTAPEKLKTTLRQPLTKA